MTGPSTLACPMMTTPTRRSPSSTWGRCTWSGSANRPSIRCGRWIFPQFQAPQAHRFFGSLLADAEVGFPVPCYPHCLQEADRYAQAVDTWISRSCKPPWREAVREQIRADRRHIFDAQRLSPADPAAGRYQ